MHISIQMAHFILSHYQSEIRNNLPDDSLIHNQLDETTCLMEKNYISIFHQKKLLKLFQKSALEALSNRNLQCLWKKSRVFSTILWPKPWDKGMFGWSISSAPLLSKIQVQLVVVFSLKMTSRLWRALTLQWLSKHKTNHPFFGRNNNKPVISPSGNHDQLKPATYPPMSALDKASTVSTSR